MAAKRGSGRSLSHGFSSGQQWRVTPTSMSRMGGISFTAPPLRAAGFLGRTDKTDDDVYEFGTLRLERAARRLTRDGGIIELSPKEYNLLSYFIKKSGRALTRDEILNAVWGYDCVVTSRSVDRFITTLRNKIEPNPAQPVFIHTVRQIGYRFEPAGS